MVKKRRGQNEGTIYRRPNGTWAAQVSINGKRLTAYRKTQRECREWLTETLSKQDRGQLTVSGEKVTTAEYLTKWLEIVRPTLRPRTWEQYQQIVEQHVLPNLGTIRLRDLRADHFHALYSIKLENGIGPRTLQLIHAVLHRALSHALKWGLLGHNPMSAVDRPKYRRPEMKTLSSEQARALLKAANNHRLSGLLDMAIATGLRQSELLGLKWSDIDWETGALQIQRQLRRTTGQGMQFSEPKSKSGRRTVMLGSGTLARLRKHRTRQLQERLFAGGRWQENDLIFTTPIGTSLDQRNVQREFKAILERADLPDIRFHDLRHTAATLMLQQGIHPKIVQERLGHSQISVTLDTYSHVLPSMQQEAAERLDALLGM